MKNIPIARIQQTLPWYRRGYRRMLVDMHIPDWDERFLSKYDPVKMADLYELAELTSVMFYCQSHVGLCYWPTKTGRMHAGLRGRDIVAELLKELKTRGIAACAYYSLIYNNWAFLEHPDWRIQSAGDSSDGSFAGSRYGHCCPNNPDYREFALAQTEELVGNYDFDGLFFDMTFWPAVCLCSHCRTIFKKETGKEIPLTIDWFSGNWCEFQLARERWITRFGADLTTKAKALNHKMSVYHNFAPSIFNWTLGLPFTSAVHHDFLGADFYGDALEQLVVSKLMLNLTENRPLEFMTSRCVNLRDHVRLKQYETMEMQAFAATLFSGAFLFIDAINVDGTVNSAVYERIRRIYQETKRYETYLGGEQVEDVGIYFSGESKMDFLENGTPIGQSPMWGSSYPHLKAVRGVCRVLQQAHLPFGVITRKQLPKLDRYRVVVLPNIMRMDQEEVEAFRAYVRRGGRLYASRYTSLVEARGIQHADFMLADVFGGHLAADDLGMITYLKPSVQELTQCITPQNYVSNFPLGLPQGMQKDSSAGMLRLKKQSEGTVLATLTLPYASPAQGTVFDQSWASIHSSPPWEDTDHPVIINHQFGNGQTIYCAADIESVDSEVNNRLFLSLLRRLLDGEPSYTADTHPAVWMNVFHQEKNTAFLVGFLNYQAQLPAVPIRHIPFSLRPPEGKHFISLLALPEETTVNFALDTKGTLHAEVRNLSVFQLLRAQYSG